MFRHFVNLKVPFLWWKFSVIFLVWLFFSQLFKISSNCWLGRNFLGASSSVEWLKIFPTSGSIPSHYISTLKRSRVQIPFGLSNFNVFYLVVILPAIHNFSNSWIGEGKKYLWWSQFCRMAEIFAPPSYLSVLRSWRVTIPFIQ